MITVNRSKYVLDMQNRLFQKQIGTMLSVLATVTMPSETYFDPFSGTMIEDIGDDDVFVAERDVKIPEGMLL